ncbi:MAG: hypothetical protein IJB74_06870, partial [Clostridia bacterium]|nr:hypothetical protein [Clostridia bacterium]
GDSQLNTDNISGYNMFVYCYNNPVVLSDSEGNRPIVGAGPISKETADERRQSAAVMNSKITKTPPKQKKGTLKGLLKTAVDAFSVEAGAGFGFGVSAEAGPIGLEASVKGNPLHLVLTTDSEERGLYYTFEGNVSADIVLMEAFTKDSYKYEFWTGADVSEGKTSDFKFKDTASLGVSLYFFIGGEIEVSYNYGRVIDYIKIM